MGEVPGIRRAANLLVGYGFQPWFYGDSVGLEGLLCASELLDDPTYEGFVQGMARGAMARDGAPRPMDNTVPGYVLTELAVRRRDTRLLEDLGRLIAFLQQRPTVHGVPISLEQAGLMLPYGGVVLPPDELALVADPGAAVYVDCLHFDPPFFVAYGLATGDEGLVNQGIAMAEAFADLLQGDRRLYDHFYLLKTERTYIPGWTRGQGWAALGLLDVIESVGVDDPRVQGLRDSLTRMSGAMIETQRPDGHWGSLATLESGVETSAAAFFASVFMRMRRLGIGWPEADEAGARAFNAMLSAVDDTGWMRGVSATVWSSTQMDHYLHVPLDYMVPWSQGPLLIALHEFSRNQEEGTSPWPSHWLS